MSFSGSEFNPGDVAVGRMRRSVAIRAIESLEVSLRQKANFSIKIEDQARS
jgi:hypothetical protein